MRVFLEDSSICIGEPNKVDGRWASSHLLRAQIEQKGGRRVNLLSELKMKFHLPWTSWFLGFQIQIRTYIISPLILRSSESDKITPVATPEKEKKEAFTLALALCGVT